MDKNEYKLKLDQLKDLVEMEDYESAVKIADEINWKKVRNANTLCMVGDIYDRLGRYDACRDVLLQAYEHSPIGRTIVGKLAQVAIKTKNVREAETYYNDFVGIAPKDNQRYILAYQIACLKNAPVTDRIAILEELKEKEYSEKWAYELAALYSQANMREKCVEACDDLILWFGDGEYVERAMNLKRKFQPLSPSQEEKYRKSQENAQMVEISLSPKGEEGDEGEEASGITVTASKFNTLNLQEELENGIAQIMNATQRETVADTMNSIKRLVGDIPYLQTEHEAEPGAAKEEINERVDEGLKVDFQERLGQQQSDLYNGYLSEDIDGQMNMQVSEQGASEPQVEGQMNIEDVLAEWEKTKRAAEEAIAVAEQKKLELEKEQALREAGDIMERLKALLPLLSATPGEDLPQEEDTVASTLVPDGPVEEEKPEEEGTPEAETPEAEVPESGEEAQTAKTAAAVAATAAAGAAVVGAAAAVDNLFTGDTSRPEEGQYVPEPEMEQPEQYAAEQYTQGQYAQEQYAQEQYAQEQYAQEQYAPQPEPVVRNTMSFRPQNTAAEDIRRERAATQRIRAVEERFTMDLPVDEIRAQADLPEVGLPEDMAGGRGAAPGRLNKEQRELFSYFLPVPGMEEQICQVLMGASERAGNAVTSLSGNILIQGEEGSGKTVLATSLIKAIQKIVGKEKAKIGKISAAALNHKDFASFVPRIGGGYLIVDKAGDLTAETAARMSQVMEGNTQGMVVLLEDSKAGIKHAMSLDFGFAKKFTEKINIPIFTIDELVDFGKSYAEEMECTIDEMGILALYNRINNIQKLDRATTLAEVKEIVDEAIESAEGGGIKRAFGSLFSKKYNDNDYLILREKDFEH